MRSNKKEKMGNHICKIGKYDIREVVKRGSVERRFSSTTTKKGSCEGRVYIGKKLVESNLKGSYEAIKKAFLLTCEEGNEHQVSKTLIKRYNLVCE